MFSQHCSHSKLFQQHFEADGKFVFDFLEIHILFFHDGAANNAFFDKSLNDNLTNIFICERISFHLFINACKINSNIFRLLLNAEEAPSSCAFRLSLDSFSLLPYPTWERQNKRFRATTYALTGAQWICDSLFAAITYS